MSSKLCQQDIKREEVLEVGLLLDVSVYGSHTRENKEHPTRAQTVKRSSVERQDGTNNMKDDKLARYFIDQSGFPEKFPTHKHEASFWESLGRAVATFGFLEEILGKAIFAFTATRSYEKAEIAEAYDEWLPKLERALIDPLGNLIDAYGKAVRDNSDAVIENFDEILGDLRKASQMRNILCHGSWRLPDTSGASIPFFVNRKKEIVDSAMDCQFLDQVQKHTADLACVVINTVTQMGLQFPGSAGLGKTIW